MRKLSFLVCFAVILVFGSPHGVVSQDYCFEQSGNRYGIAPALLWAISKEESRFNPYALNFNRNGSYDYCHMQINSSWASEIGETAWASLGDPCQCTQVGAWILSRCIRDYGYTWQAVGCYHAKDKNKRVSYSWKIYNVLKK
jgi:soluble lytic murein transglycosylase-like protein